ncbi:MAG: hypothetical protein P8I62_04735 [Pseudomonadales bacterium]|nr:hypothetical protein [Pseudomonadales bacterium]
MQAAVVAFEIGVFEYTNALLNDAHTKIATVYSGDAAAKAARSKFVPEANKDFKGEPYERAMVGYYLGLSEMLSGELDEAGVSFRWGELQDTMSASEEYQSDFALLNFLDGWTKKCRGDDSAANDSFVIAKKHAPHLIIPKNNHNLLIIAESGSGPRKVASGKYSEHLSYQDRVHKSERNFDVIADYGNQKIKLVSAADIFFQANTLGGREVDKILAGKAQFKDNAKTTSDIAAMTAITAASVAQTSYYSGNRDAARAATAVAGIAAIMSVAAAAAAEAATPEADTRYWYNLPRKVSITTAQYNNDDDISLSFNKVNESTKVVSTRIRPTGSCHLAWSRDSTEITWDGSSDGDWTYLQAGTNSQAGINSNIKAIDASARSSHASELLNESVISGEKKRKKNKRSVPSF